jgi:FKBP-type peptidyl-prolyl cis-trans isomerase
MLKKKLSRVTAVTALFLSASFAPISFADTELKTVIDRISYVFGYQVGQRLKQDQVEINIDVYMEALKDAKAGKPPGLTEEEMSSAMRAFQDIQQAKVNETMQVIAAANLKEGVAFLEKNVKAKGVITTESGLQYKILTTGTGPKPEAGNTVKVNYVGMLLDGSEFDRSEVPAVFGIEGVIPGWTEALLLMHEGSKWKLYVPSDLAYGPGGVSRSPIGPNALLIFEVELLEAKHIIERDEKAE